MMYAATAISFCVFVLAANVLGQAQDTYPHVDEDGYYLAYKVSR